jgi:hypothetical protein
MHLAAQIASDHSPKNLAAAQSTDNVSLPLVKKRKFTEQLMINTHV